MSKPTKKLLKLGACLLLVVITLALCGGCVHRSTPAPQFAGTLRQAASVSTGIQDAQEDNKEVKSLHRQSLGLLDRLDYKTTVLLEK